MAYECRPFELMNEHLIMSLHKEKSAIWCQIKYIKYENYSIICLF